MSYKKPKKNNHSRLPKGPNPEVFKGKPNESTASKNAVHAELPGGDLPILPSQTGQDKPLFAYIQRLAEESEMYFPRFAQDHMVLLRQRRYDSTGALSEMTTCTFGSPSMTQEEAVALLEEVLESVRNGFDFRFAKGDPDADPLAFVQSPPTEIEPETEQEKSEGPEYDPEGADEYSESDDE